MLNAPRITPPGIMNSEPITIAMALAFLSCTHPRLGTDSDFLMMPPELMLFVFFGTKSFLEGMETLSAASTFEQAVRHDSTRKPISFAVVQQSVIPPTKSTFFGRSISLNWLRHVFDMPLMPTPTVAWNVCLDFGVYAPGSSTLPRDWNATRLHPGCSTDACTCKLLFDGSARARRVLDTMVFGTKRMHPVTERMVQSTHNNFHELFSPHTRRFMAKWLSARDDNATFLLSEPSFEDIGMLNLACQQTSAKWVLKALWLIWGRQNCDRYVRVRCKAEGLQIFVVGRHLVPEQITSSRLFDKFRNKARGLRYL